MPQESRKIRSTKVSKPRKNTSKKIEKGLGDTIENLIPDVVKDIVTKIAGEDCGCGKRKAYLNKRFAYFNPFNEEDKKLWAEVLAPALHKGVLNRGVQQIVIDLYFRTFQKMSKKTNCGSCVEGRMLELQKAYEASCDE
tara:strand:+ start:89 stop:505 length:417 start_codon:yes stop_codon:yes gene_type:complete